MATRFELVLQGVDTIALRAAGEEALAEVGRIENQLSLYRPGSEISQVNSRASRGAVQVSPEVFSLLQHAAKMTAETDGAFDITIAPLVRCWGFMGANGQMPSPEEIAVARETVGMNLVELDAARRTVRFTREGVMLDLGAIGKGYAVERGAELLREAGVTSALFHGGTSTTCAIGHPADDDAWRVSFDVPERYGGTSLPILPEMRLRDVAMSVSAIWGRAFQSGKKTFGHVIDPRTGMPVEGTLLTAVVLPSATETDALSTALLTLGRAGHQKMNQLRSEIRSVVVGSDGVFESL